MKRRQFIHSSVAALAVSAVTNSTESAAAVKQNNATTALDYYELRRYLLRFSSKQELINNYFRDAAIPAMNRHGISAVGAFNVMVGPDSPALYVLIPHKTFDSVSTIHSRLAADNEYQKAAASFLSIPPTDPAYIRMESSLMVAFTGMPKLEVPATAAEKKPRIFELRTYESPGERAAKKKIEMFNIGEIAIFRRTGLQPVFFGETIIGPRMPNLTYMLTYSDMATRDKNWATFIADPEWKKLSATPGFSNAEILTNISSVFLRPTAYSQI